MQEILNRCNNLYDQLPDCKDKYINQNKNGCCLTCTKYNFRRSDNDSYDCLKKLCTYTMFYGPIYVSEIYHFLVQSDFLLGFINERRESIKKAPFSLYDSSTQNRSIPISLNIMSLGCGFGPDDIALSKYRWNYLDINVNFDYIGYDIEPLWNYITQSNAVPLTKNLLNGMNFEDVDIIFLNKLFSTLKNLGLHNDFLIEFDNALEELPVGSYVVFNDVNNYKEGRDIFDKFVQKKSFEVVSKFYSYQQHDVDWIQLENTNNICLTPTSLVITPKNYFTDLIFFLYKKVT